MGKLWEPIKVKTLRISYLQKEPTSAYKVKLETIFFFVFEIYIGILQNRIFISKPSIKEKKDQLYI